MAATVLLALVSMAMIWSRFRQRQKINRKLKEINETKSRFFANISHEFRTPLTLLAGPLEIMMAGNREDDRQLLQMMYRNVNRLLLLNNQLMDLSRLESGALKLKLRKGNIVPALKGMALSFDSLAGQREITYKAVFHDEELICFFDEDKLEKIVYNLLSNAFKFTPDKGSIDFEVRRTSRKGGNGSVVESLEIMVTDTGKGIPAEHLPLIFDRFYQADNHLNREFEGTGLGLAITHELVEMHLGAIRVASEPGKSTKFTVTLPLDPKSYPPESFITAEESDDEGCLKENDPMSAHYPPGEKMGVKGTEAAEQENDPEKPVILIVEDNADMRVYIRSALGDDFHFIEAPDGEKGYNKAIEDIPGLIITDLMMPNTDGVQLCEMVKSDERTSHIPVIMLTALATVEHRIRGLETGADDYITKPFHREELKTRCNNLIAQRRMLHEKYRKGLVTEPGEISVTSADERFLKKLLNTLENHISNPELDVDLLIREVGMSRSQLHKKLKALTGLSTTEFVRNYRLKRAATLLRGNYGNVADVCYAVGFNSLSYFTRCFHELYGIAPSGYKTK
ncbi:MAG: response regulator [Bacteroidales bacterium]|nr:response regulator [Bacteroidales bacterium]